MALQRVPIQKYAVGIFVSLALVTPLGESQMSSSGAGQNHGDPYFSLRVSCEDTKFKPHIDWLISEMFSCSLVDRAQDRSPCNRFVGKALERIWGLHDFRAGFPPSKSEFYDANHIATYLSLSHPPWEFIGLASEQTTLTRAQQLANDSVPVVAVMSNSPGHVALILPGKLSFSSNWNAMVPNSAATMLDNPKASYVGKRLSNTFTAEVRSRVKLYYRVP